MVRSQTLTWWEISAKRSGKVEFSLVIQSLTVSRVMLSSARSKVLSSNQRVLEGEQSRIKEELPLKVDWVLTVPSHWTRVDSPLAFLDLSEEEWRRISETQGL